MQMRWLSAAACLLLAGSVMMPAESKTEQVIPGFTAYVEPNPEAMEIPESGPVKGWSDSNAELAWYGQIRATGRLQVAVRLELPAGDTATLDLRAGKKELGRKTVSGTGAEMTVPFGSIEIKKPGAYRFALRGIQRSGKDFGAIDALVLDEPAAVGALFNLTPQRGAPSVHLHYPLPDGVQAEWFYNEVTAKTDPLWSYYEACGFARGYFGIQVNSPTERRIIFSVWDSGKESTDRSKVAAEDRVQLLAKGDGVEASSFGNEGTGGHSHMVYPWKTGETYRFLVHARPEGDATIYTAWFYFPEKQAWGLIASFRAPKDGGYLRGLYSFNEDFDGANGQQKRLAEFGNQWVRTTDGRWLELTEARFTHTARGLYKDRIDRAAGVVGNRFFLTSGNFEASTMEYGDVVKRPAVSTLPVTELPKEPGEK